MSADLQKRIADILEQQCGSEIGVEDYLAVAGILVEKLGLIEECTTEHWRVVPRARMSRYTTPWVSEEQAPPIEPVMLADECLRCHHQIDDHRRVAGFIDPCMAEDCECIDLDLTGWSLK